MNINPCKKSNLDTFVAVLRCFGVFWGCLGCFHGPPKRTGTDRNGLLCIPTRTLLVQKWTLWVPKRTGADRNGLLCIPKRTFVHTETDSLGTETDRNGLLCIPKRTLLVPKRTLWVPKRTGTDRNVPERTETDFCAYRNGLSEYRNGLSGYRNGLL